MAIYRNIQMTFWTDTKVSDDFTPEDKYFYLYLMTNPHTNLSGCYEISIRQMSNETGYSKDTVERLVLRFSEVHRVIEYDLDTKEILLINWSKHNWTKSKDFRKALIREIEHIKCSIFKSYLMNIYEGVETVPRPSLHGVGTTDTVTVTDTDTDTDNNKYINNIDIQYRAFGEYNNVMLTDDELSWLKRDFPDYEERINRLSEYMASTGKKYKSHYATIRNWARKDKEKKETKKSSGAEELDEYYSMVSDWVNKE